MAFFKDEQKRLERIVKDIKSLQRKRSEKADYDTRYRLFLVYATVQKKLIKSEVEYKECLKEFNNEFLKPIYDWQVEVMASEIFEYDGDLDWRTQDIAEFLNIKKYEVSKNWALRYNKNKVCFIPEPVAALYLGVSPEYLKILVYMGLIKNDGRYLQKMNFLSRKLKAFRLEHPFWDLRLKVYTYIEGFKQIDYIKQARIGINENGDVINLDTLKMCTRFKNGGVHIKLNEKIYIMDIGKLLAHTLCDNKLNKPFYFFIDENRSHVNAGNILCVTREEIDKLNHLLDIGDRIGYLILIDNIKKDNAGLPHRKPTEIVFTLGMIENNE